MNDRLSMKSWLLAYIKPWAQASVFRCDHSVHTNKIKYQVCSKYQEDGPSLSDMFRKLVKGNTIEWTERLEEVRMDTDVLMTAGKED